MDFLNLIKLDIGVKGLQPLLPLSTLLFLAVILISKITLASKATILLFCALLISLIIFFEVKKYIKSIKTLLLTMLAIYLANMAFALGSIIALLGLKNLIVNKIYAYSRWNAQI